MAYPTEKSKRLAELVRQGEAARSTLTDAHRGLMHAIDLPSRIKSSITSAPAKWLGGSLLAGLATSFIFRKREKKTSVRTLATGKEHGPMYGLATLVFTLSKPALKIYATKLLKDYLTRRFLSGAHGHPATLRTPPY
jgi:hypothetical protein